MSAESDILWELMDSNAVVKYYFDRPSENFKATDPAIIICDGVFTKPQKKQHNYTLYFGHGMAYFSFNKLSQATDKADEIIEKAKSTSQSLVVRRVNRYA